jgi:xylulose-5-phosphate/fructose-6-phosphate phosphoketolase
MTGSPQDELIHDEVTQDDLELVDRWWRAANYLSVGQIYLRSNPLLREPLAADHTKSRLLGHWGTTPGLNFVYAHLNRVIRRDLQEMLFVAGPGHGGPAVVANAWLEGTYSEIYGAVGPDGEGMAELFRQFSYPGGIPSHAAPETPGSISEGGELGYALAHAYGSVFDNPQLITAVVIGDGEAETGPLAASWHSHNFLDPVHDGAVLPILHLNGYKIANPTILARMPEEQLVQLLRGYGHEPYFVTVTDPDNTAQAHRDFAAILDRCLADIKAIQDLHRQDRAAEEVGEGNRRWPMIVLRSPKGWTGPRIVDGKQVEGTWRSHQVPLAEVRTNAGHLKELERWLKSYRPEELFDTDGRLRPGVATNAPSGLLRMSATPHANGGLLRKPLKLPAYAAHAVEVQRPGTERISPMITLGSWMRDVISLNMETFRLFGPVQPFGERSTIMGQRGAPS